MAKDHLYSTHTTRKDNMKNKIRRVLHALNREVTREFLKRIEICIITNGGDYLC